MDKMQKPKPMPRPKPTIHGITEKDLPAIKNWKVGGKYTITLVVEQTAARKGDDWDMPYDFDSGKERPKVLSADFKILEITSDDDDKEELKDRYGKR